MLKNIYAPSDINPENVAPDVSFAEQIRTVGSSPVTFNEPNELGTITANLPYGAWASGAIFTPQGSDVGVLVLDNLFVGPSEMQQRGVGTRLLRAITKEAAIRNEAVNKIVTGWARLGVLNTMIHAFGESAVAVENAGKRFGEGSDVPLATIFEHKPPVQGEAYKIWSIQAKFAREAVLAWHDDVIH